jgi:enediyne biosynthesis protein E4
MIVRGGYILIIICLITGCAIDDGCVFYEVPSSESGVDFQNTLTETPDFNIFNYMYFYNGGGVAVGDVNGDDLPDLYFTANQSSNRLFLNLGGLRFKDVTSIAGVSGYGGWATGVSMADVNGDGLLDIYVCYVGDHSILKGRNQLFINKGLDSSGLPVFEEQAKEYGIDLVGFSTQGAFFDYDNDGDLDMYMLNHSLHQNGTFGPANDLRSKSHPTAGDKLLRNDIGRFTDITNESGIFSSALGYGLGIAISDVNLDGFLDIYIGNDFHENDYLYINQGDGTFINSLESNMGHTSRYTMGVDFADFNNDAFPDLISMDMLPHSYERQQASATEDPYETYHFKKEFGYNEQYTRNMLQLNNRNGTYSEIALISGLHATDWSWATFFADFDLDGDKDIFISNGIRRRSNDLDYINFISDASIQKQLGNTNRNQELSFIEKMPEVKIRNFVFANNGDLTFTDKSQDWGFVTPSYSNGAAYADLDNDGDLDLVTNNINDRAFVYENRTIKKSSTQSSEKKFLQVKLLGSSPNTFGIGAKVFVFTNNGLQIQECMPTKGFQSSVDYRLNFGFRAAIDSVVVVWNNGSFQRITNVSANQQIVIKQSDATGKFDYNAYHPKGAFFELEDSVTLGFKHKENRFPEFDKEALLPYMLSTEGPAIAVGDVNQDGLEDVFVGGAKRQVSQIYLQKNNGDFTLSDQKLLSIDSVYEDVDAVFFDADGDKDMDLLVASGGNEFIGKSKYQKPRIYLNDGLGNFIKYGNLPEVFLSASCVSVTDIENDGDLDVFLGARAIPGMFGKAPASYILANDGDGNFTNVTNELTQDFNDLGFVKDAVWADMDKDGYKDLIVALEWKPITIFYNKQGIRLNSTSNQELSGWWNSLAIADFDQDGDMDIVGGNLGRNSKLKATNESPVKMYVNDFDSNGTIEQVLTFQIDGVEYPLNTRDELAKQLPFLKKNILSYKKFSNSRLTDLFPKKSIDESLMYQVNTFESVYMENRNGEFYSRPLPIEAQFSTINSILVRDFNGDGKLDLLTGGNFFNSNIQMGRYDASYGNLLLGDGKGNFRAISGADSGFSLNGQIRSIVPIGIKGNTKLLVTRNNDSIKIFSMK